jgi:3-hydroxy-D-aspartate aldolase
VCAEGRRGRGSGLGGVPDILVSNEVVGAPKLARLAALAKITKIGVCADHPAHVTALEAAAADAGVRLQVLVELDVWAGRCGIAPGADAVSLAQRIAASRHLTFGGLQAYHGSAQHKRTLAERTVLIENAVAASRLTVEMLADKGLSCAIVGGGGTGTFELESASGVYTEIQAGSYIFMDADYGLNLDANGAPISTFRNALFVLSTVMSVPGPRTVVLDAGLKALAVDSGMPLIWQRPDLLYVGASDEHGKVEVATSIGRLALGEKLRLVPGHCDPTVDRYDWYVGVRNERVECLWPICARGGMY